MACMGETERSPEANASGYGYVTYYEHIDSQDQNGICKKIRAKEEPSLTSGHPTLGWEQSKALGKTQPT